MRAALLPGLIGLYSLVSLAACVPRSSGDAPKGEVSALSRSAAPPEPAPPPPPPPRPQLPRGGRALFPQHRLIGYCGTPGAPALGKLMGNLASRAKEIEAYGDKYAHGRTPLPVFELIAVVVQGGPGADGKYRRRVPESVIDHYLEVARASRAILLLNIQPGHSDFVTEVKALEKYLREPDVGVALDPEWAMSKPKQKPGASYGQTTGAVINEVTEYLSGLVQKGDLPEKALVFHQVNNYVVKDETALKSSPGVVVIKSVDGLGPKAAKIATYNFLVKTMTPGVHAGFKLFFDEDLTNGGRLMTPPEVMALQPEPEYVMYE